MNIFKKLPMWVWDNAAYYVDLSKIDDSATGVQKDKPVSANIGGSANVLSSRVMHVHEYDGSRDMHTPMIDLDIPHKLIPSSTPGHSHLYLDVKLTHDQYHALLKALLEAGIIQGGIMDQFCEHGATFLRLPGVYKGYND